MALTTNYRAGLQGGQADLADFSAHIVQDEWIDRRFIEVLRERLVFLPLGRGTDMPGQISDRAHWNLFNNPLPDTTVLTTEGDDPTNTSDLTVTAITADLQEFSSGFLYTKVLRSVGISGTLEQMVTGLAHKASLTIDKLCQAGTSENGALASVSSASKLDAGSSMTVDQLRLGVLKLLENNAQPHPGTPGGQFFCFAGSVEAVYDMLGEGSPAWFQVKDTNINGALQQPPPMQNAPAQAGAYNAIVKVSSNIQRTAVASPAFDDDLNYLIGDSAFGIISLDSNVMDPQVIMTPPEQNTSAPARNRGTAAYWFLFAAKLLDEKRVFQISSDATGISTG